MNVLVLGGTGFIGSHGTRLLLGRGHDVTLFHRGPCVAAGHIHAPFKCMSDYAADFRRLRPDVVLDMVPYMDRNGHGVAHLRGIADRAVVISSCDVYRAFGRLWRSEPGPPDALPLDEEAPLRARPAADRSADDAFDNLEVERAALDDPAFATTILRLPATHGPGDPQHRLKRYLEPMREGRATIVLGPTLATWRWSRGYVENVAAAVALATTDDRAAGRIYNVASPRALMEAEWVRAIGETAGWNGDVSIGPEGDLPKFDFNHHLEVDTTRIRTELGYLEHVDEATGLERTVAWELSALTRPA